MPADHPTVSVSEALAEVMAHADASLLPPESVPLLDACDRVLAEELVAARDLPPWRNSSMDGYAVRAEDVRAGSSLAVVEEVHAGAAPAKRVEVGTAVKIMTGAPMPEGADTVLPKECARQTGGTVEIVEGRMPLPRPGEYVRPAGEDVRTGEVVMPAGTLLTPAAIGVAASLGRAVLQVRQRPRVAILATGDEIAEIGEVPGPQQIHASSTWALAAAIGRIGAVPVQMGIARDRREELVARVEAALACDVVLTTGGVSVGDKDFVAEAVRSLGAEVRIHGVAQRPGHPLLFARVRGRLFFGLPGNPVSTLVCFEEYVQPALLRMAGHPRPFLPVVEATLEGELRIRTGRFQFVRGVLTRGDGGFRVRSAGNQSSGALTSMLRGNCLVLLPAEATGAPDGAVVRVQVLDPSFWNSPAADL